MTLLNRVAERIALLAARVEHQCRCLSSVV